MAILLARRLMARGYTLPQLLPLFQEAESRLSTLRRTGPRNPPATTLAANGFEDPTPIFFHLHFHPRGIQRTQICDAYNKTLAPLLKQDRRLIVAASRPRNLQDWVCMTCLPDITDNNPSDFITCGDNSHSPQILPEGWQNFDFQYIFIFQTRTTHSSRLPEI
jgi:hypothetical protein